MKRFIKWLSKIFKSKKTVVKNPSGGTVPKGDDPKLNYN
jgi:hypothetical protein